ncbi:Myosin N-terminal SH3-like domain [Nesidiocoris tenuis]|uniref:Myosin N-terminal SH3-like domain n=1 Tax=Nesidiocoris tenuis TaxID=355587 RepID=A0ABN7A8N5_9HEMI|nr:Myosin N-terminal SH3-like domain [Nesidiocoris tenuis]
MEQQKVWVSDPTEGFVPGVIVDIGMDEVTVQPLNNRKAPKVTVSLERLYLAEEYDNKDFDDNCSLMNLNEATLLNNIRNRYKKDKIYTYVANILIAVNPYFEIKDLYSSKIIKQYQGKSLGVMPPHVFAIADKSFRDMKTLKQSQSIIVSGESGAGKTESTKYLLRYLCDLWGTAAGPIEQKILDANPILEAFGNAKTTRNNNSSRFGKFMEVHFDSKCAVVGGFISHYLLEKSRIVMQSQEERNYHVFYLLCAGAPDEMRQVYKLTKPDDFHYLRNGCTQYFTNNNTERKLNNTQKSAAHASGGGLKDPMLDDVEDFTNMDKALSRLGLEKNEKLEIYAMVAAVLHLGNVSFEEDAEGTKGGCKVTPDSESSLAMAASLLFVDKDELRQALLNKVMMTARGGPKGTIIMVPLKVYEANSARDALAKALYSKLFDYIVQRINKSIPFQASSYYVGVLDIAGFEYFTVNSFEQFCINYCNEKLQQFFNERILKDEQELYQREGLQVKKIDFIDNQDCIDLIEGKGSGLFSLLDEESKLPKPSAEHFTNEVHKNWGTHFRLALPRASKLKAHREIRDSEGFLVRHFAGAVCYDTSKFIEKNNDALHASLEGLVQESQNPFLRNMFGNAVNSNNQKGKLTFISVGSKFQTQLGELMDKLKSTGTSFIRCIKPNQKMVDHQFEGGSILSQLQCSGMTSVLELMQQGYPSRTGFSELYDMYSKFLPPELARLDARLFCKLLFRALGMSEKDFRFGVSKIFFKPGKFAEFDAIMRSDPENLAKMVSMVKKWLLMTRWKKVQWCALSVIKLDRKIKYRAQCHITIQKNIRMYLARKQHRPRYKGIQKINNLQSIISRMEALIGQMKKDKDSSLKEMKNLQHEMKDSVKKIKLNPKIKPEEVNAMHTSLMNKANRELAKLQQKLEFQKDEEEKERLKKIEEEIRKERERREKEEKEKQMEEQNKKLKVEMEMRRQLEEEAQKLLEEKNKVAEMKLQLEREKQEQEELCRRGQLEQERRDHELALRLAHESNSQVDDILSPTDKFPGARMMNHNSNNKLNRPEHIKNQTNNNTKYDLSKWKYSELRDTINTSCDIELLEACRHEFHRRLKIYHAWKAKNKHRSVMNENERAPRSIMDAASNAARTPTKEITNHQKDSQRYFRIPFIRPSLTNGHGDSLMDNSNKRGWWYAHFDGQYVARQMELHPDKPAILLKAGVDDMQMCELSLEETGLTRKRGAEILEQDFTREWEKHGGSPYIRPVDRIK